MLNYPTSQIYTSLEKREWMHFHSIENFPNCPLSLLKYFPFNPFQYSAFTQLEPDREKKLEK
jgi:hypothetical protein